ncbi:MAG: NAD(+)/NADH kinase [Bacteroidetes bacterium]|nr:NAD(+)/NADH kinase [Bacteroidota bacterium]
MKFGICGNLEKEELPRVVEKFIRRCRKEKIQFVLPDTLLKGLRGRIDRKFLSKSNIVPENRIQSACDIIVSIGGDGTILRIARLVSENSTPILGINLGKLGFLTEVTVDELDDCFDEILNGDYKIEDRMMVQARINGSKRSMLALNDIVLSQTDSSRMFDVQTFMNGELLSIFTCDGTIVATPTGSTAYVLSNGGPIVTPTNRSLLINPICPHSLTARTVVVPEESVITLKVQKAHGKMRITADGQSQVFVHLPLEVVIERSSRVTRLVKRMKTSYYDVLRRKLNWGRDARNS